MKQGLYDEIEQKFLLFHFHRNYESQIAAYVDKFVSICAKFSAFARNFQRCLCRATQVFQFVTRGVFTEYIYIITRKDQRKPEVPLSATEMTDHNNSDIAILVAS